jgi:carotenoid cleavage dioxygenase
MPGRAGGEVARCDGREVRAGLHVVDSERCADEGHTIVLDVVRHPKMLATDFHGPNEGPTTLDRWTVDLADGKIRETRLDDHPQEFPRIDDRLVGRPHRYGYAMQTPSTGGTAGDSVLKHDLTHGQTTARRLGTHQR